LPTPEKCDDICIACEKKGECTKCKGEKRELVDG